MLSHQKYFKSQQNMIITFAQWILFVPIERSNKKNIFGQIIRVFFINTVRFSHFQRPEKIVRVMPFFQLKMQYFCWTIYRKHENLRGFCNNFHFSCCNWSVKDAGTFENMFIASRWVSTARNSEVSMHYTVIVFW